MNTVLQILTKVRFTFIIGMSNLIIYFIDINPVKFDNVGLVGKTIVSQ